MGRNHTHGSASSDRRWLAAALGLIVAFMVGEVVAGLVAHSLALLSDAAHMLTDAVALLVAMVSVAVMRRPARGAYTYGFARVDALSGQANGITLVLLAVFFEVQGVRHLVDPPDVRGGVVTTVAVIGAVVNVAAVMLARRADPASLSVRGAVAHLVNDAWAFAATLVGGIVVLLSGWSRADAIASMVIGLLMLWTGQGLVRAAGRIFLEAAPSGVDPHALGGELAAIDGVAELHDLHVWQLGPHETALSAHVLVRPPFDCHEVSSRLREVLAGKYAIGHVTLQADHADAPTHLVGDCEDAHGEIHISGA
jgi:cobalt-zinc-cadmium efflux system protein